MRLTHEADYAVRIVFTMMQGQKLMSARIIAEEAGITLRFALKILRKLAAAKIVIAVKGAAGGYRLAVKPENLPLGQVVECIDGPFELAHCMTEAYDCTRMEEKAVCGFHGFYREVSHELRERFYSVTLADFRVEGSHSPRMEASNALEGNQLFTKEEIEP